MENYENLYYFLFNRLTDLSLQIEETQKMAEELFIRQPEGLEAFLQKKAE